MGSPRPLRLGALALVVLAAAFTSVSAAHADTGSDAAATASAFLDALARGDAARACALFTPEALESLGGEERCTRALTDETAGDAGALETLVGAYAAARKSAAKRKGRYVTKAFDLRALARDIERRDPQLTVKLGRGPQAAAGQLVTTAVLDLRSTGRRLVLYAESDDGSILRLSAPSRGAPSLEEVAMGVPEAPPPGPPQPAFSFRIDTVIPLGDNSVLARATLTFVEDGRTHVYTALLLLTRRGDAYLVDNIFYSILDGSQTLNRAASSEPLVASPSL